MTDNEILKLAVENGIIDLAPIYAKVEEVQRKSYLKMHTNKVWQGNNGFWYTYIDEPTGRRLVKKKSQEDIKELIIGFYKTQCESPTFEECFQQWADSKLEHGEIQKQTYDRYSTDFIRFFDVFGKRYIKDISESDLYELIINTISDKELTSKAWSGMRTLLLGTFKYAKRKGYTQISISTFMSDLDISRGIFKRRRFSDEESVFTQEEVKIIQDAIAREGFTVLNLGVLLAFETGLRAGELSALKYSDLERNVLNVSKTEIFYKSNGKYVYEVRDATKGKYDARKVVLTQRAIQIIDRLHALNPDSDYLFVKDGKRIHGKNFTSKIVRICENNGMKPRSLHKCRKTYVTMLADSGISEKVICGQVGHTDFSTTRNYYWFNNKTVDEVKEMLEIAMK